MASLYETDYYGWTLQIAARLRAGQLEGLDLNEIAEEIEDLGKSERRSEAFPQATPPAPAEVGLPTRAPDPELGRKHP